MFTVSEADSCYHRHMRHLCAVWIAGGAGIVLWCWKRSTRSRARHGVGFDNPIFTVLDDIVQERAIREDGVYNGCERPVFEL